MKSIIIAILLMMNITAIAQNNTYSVSKDSVDGGKIFNGPVTFDDLNKEATFTWLKSGTDEYKPDQRNTNYLQQHLSEYSIVVFMGTWCDDSHYLVPKLQKVLQAISYPADKVTMYGVDRAKTTNGGEDKKYGISRVPTIILFKNGAESGRITESVNNTIEADLAEIIKKDADKVH